MSPEDAWRQPWLDARKHIARQYGQHVGCSVDELVTPALVADRPTLQRNIAAMKHALAGSGVASRPHTKVQKSVDLARLQMDAGAVGVTVATVWEAAAMAAGGLDDVLIANEVVGPDKIRAAATLARYAKIAVVVDDARNVDALSEAATAAGTQLDVMVDLDVGMARCGARSLEDAVALAEQVDGHPALRLRGIQAYEGHCMLEPEPDVRQRLATEAMDYAAEVLDAVAARFPYAVTLSGGGTGTYAITGRHPRVTELQAGSYVFMDAFHGNLVPGFEVSLQVLTTVMARHGDTVILNAGRKSIGIDFVLPPITGLDYVARYYAEEHALFDVDERMTADLGDRLWLTCGYAPTTVNLHDVIFVVDDGQVVEVWPVFPRGAGHHGFGFSMLG